MSTGHSYNSQIPKIGIGYYYKDGKNERLSKSLLQTYANGRVVWNKGLSTDDPRVFSIGKKISKALIGKAQPEHLNIRRRNTLLDRYTGCKNAYYYYRKVYYMSDGLQGDAQSLAKYYSIKYNRSYNTWLSVLQHNDIPVKYNLQIIRVELVKLPEQDVDEDPQFPMYKYLIQNYEQH